jgi:hypothetical protein
MAATRRSRGHPARKRCGGNPFRFCDAQAGGVFVLINPHGQGREARVILHDCGAAAVVADRRMKSSAVAALTDVRSARALVLVGPSVGGATSDGPSSIESVAFDDLIDRGVFHRPVRQ